MDLADDPALYEGDVLAGGDFDGDFVVVEPGVGVGSAGGHYGAGFRVANCEAGVGVYFLDAKNQGFDYSVLFYSCWCGEEWCY